MLRQLTVVLLYLLLLLLDDFLVVDQDPDLHRSRVQLVALRNFAERVAHDRDDHIQRRDG